MESGENGLRGLMSIMGRTPDIGYCARVMLLVTVGLGAAFTLAHTIVTVPEGVSLASLTRALVPTFGCIGLFVVVLVAGELTVPVLCGRPQMSLGRAGILLAAGLPLAYAASRLGALGSFYAPALLGTAGAVLISLFLTIVRKDLWGLVIFFLTLPLVQFLQQDLGGGRSFFQNPSYSENSLEMVVEGTLGGYLVLSPSIVYVWLFAIFFLIKRAVLTEARTARTALDKYVVGFAGLYFASVLVSREPVVSLAYFWQFLTCGILFYLIAIFAVRTLENALVLCYALVGYAGLRMFTAYYLYLQSESYRPSALWEAAGGLWAAIGPFSVMAACMIPLVLSLAEVLPDRTKGVMLRLAAPAFFLVVLSMKARVALLTVVLTLPVGLFYKRGRRYVLAAVAVGTVVVTLFSGYSLTHVFDRLSLWNSLEAFLEDQAMRIDGWQAAGQLIGDYPLLGIGPGMWEHFREDYVRYYWTTSAGRVYIAFVHGFVPYYGVSSGVGAMLALMAIIGLTLARGIALVERAENEITRVLLVGLLWWFVIYLVVGNVSGASFEYKAGFERAALFWLPAGMIMALDRIAGAKREGTTC